MSRDWRSFLRCSPVKLAVPRKGKRGGLLKQLRLLPFAGHFDKSSIRGSLAALVIAMNPQMESKPTCRSQKWFYAVHGGNVAIS